MSLLHSIRRLFSYDAWANREVLAAFGITAAPAPRSLKLLAHILSAERAWLERLRFEKQTYPIWPDFSLEKCKLETDEMPRLWENYCSTLNEYALSASVNYKNIKGESFTSRTDDVLMHVILHSAYHRGQIAADIRAAGFTPAYTDFIHAVRQKFVE